jgi:curved DNA-binding protein CbpA
MDDYYHVLNVPRTAALEEIKEAYHRAARRHHPDKQQQQKATGGAATTTAVADGRADADDDNHHEIDDPPRRFFLLIQEAWECLGDSKKRLEYDRTLRQQQETLDRRIRNAIVLTSAECRWCPPDDDGDDEDDVFYQCRCGYELALTRLPALQGDLIACPGCSLVYDTAPLFCFLDSTSTPCTTTPSN